MLDIENLTFGWHSILFRDVHASLNAGDLVWLRGENATGKTTLLKIMSGMIPHFSRGHILEGDVRIHNLSILKNPPKTFFPRIAYLSSMNPEFYLLNKNLKQEISLVRAMLPDMIILPRYKQFCSFFPIFESLVQKPFQTMNPFEVRMALLAVFYIQNARLYFMDEILTGISKEGYDLWICFLQQLQREGCVVVLASHEPFSEKAIIWRIQDQTLITD